MDKTQVEGLLLTITEWHNMPTKYKDRLYGFIVENNTEERKDYEQRQFEVQLEEDLFHGIQEYKLLLMEEEGRLHITPELVMKKYRSVHESKRLIAYLDSELGGIEDVFIHPELETITTALSMYNSLHNIYFFEYAWDGKQYLWLEELRNTPHLGVKSLNEAAVKVMSKGLL